MKESLKDHYLYKYPVLELIELFEGLFNTEKAELIRRQNEGLPIGNFSPTVYNIIDMIVYKYQNDILSFAQKAFIRSDKFKSLPFHTRIVTDLEL